MACICSIGTSLPEYQKTQDEVKQLVETIFPRPTREKQRLLQVFDHANISKRQFVVPEQWFTEDHSFAERNKIYQHEAIKHSIKAMDHCLTNEYFVEEPITYEAIDAIFFISSTGLATPSIDAYLMNERHFREDVVRIPIWGLGCAGGVSAMARAHDWLQANPTKTALIVSVELCSLTFQKNDTSKSNFVGTALFGDGIAAMLVAGSESSNRKYIKGPSPQITKTSSHLQKNTLDVMGWDIANTGFEVIFAKSIPKLVETLWKQHVTQFLRTTDIQLDELQFFIAHPGGTKVLQAMEDALNKSKDTFRFSYQVLNDHGNMSSVTVFHVLKRVMEQRIQPGVQTIVSALGPGFSSELLSLEWSD
ncbi:type III polyketide synthase [Aquibacillus sediminis]|uniref:type III polyketide synthase n=1 Tax=Aquibacillus sediminis TaxID=2574734 RepID=UPI0011087B70|nr:3-oxoacyl-[acyl-carrier-protein] synthase III C-terminal domain-containing protein [Aquibacillus sediminis]